MERVSGIATPTSILRSIHIPLKLTNSNTGRGHARYAKANDRADIERLLLSLNLRETPLEFPVALHLTRYLAKGERLWDMDSGLRGNAKELIDSLVAIGWFHDDSPRWISEVRFFQDNSQRNIGGMLLQLVLQHQ